MTLMLQDFQTIPHIRSKGWWTLRKMNIEWAVARELERRGSLSDEDEFMIRLSVAKLLELKVAPPPLPISRGELRYR